MFAVFAFLIGTGALAIAGIAVYAMIDNKKRAEQAREIEARVAELKRAEAGFGLRVPPVRGFGSTKAGVSYLL